MKWKDRRQSKNVDDRRHEGQGKPYTRREMAEIDRKKKKKKNTLTKEKRLNKSGLKTDCKLRSPKTGKTAEESNYSEPEYINMCRIKMIHPK